MKKILAFVIVLSLAFSSFVVYGETENQYYCSDWAKESVEKAFGLGFLDNEKEYEFQTDISRLDFCGLIFCLVAETPYFMSWCEENIEEDQTELPSFIERPFVDTEDVGVLFLHHIGIIAGKTETEFAPDDKLTRQEAATIIVRMLDVVSPMAATEMWYEYSDIKDISDWALNSVQIISNLGFMKGVGDNSFAPKDTYTTEQAVATVIRVHNANIMNWVIEVIKKDAGELGYVYENDTWNYVTYDMAVGRRVIPIDVDKDEFKLLEYENFARDNDSVYFMAHKIEGSDPDTFEVISTKDRRNYAKDKNFVYIYSRDGGGVFKVIGADPATFEVLEFPYAKDKNDAYNCCLPLYVDDVSKFEVIEGGGISITTSAEHFLETEPYFEDNAKYNKEKYGFLEGTVIYSNDGKAKTENLYYEGYRLVEKKQ